MQQIFRVYEDGADFVGIADVTLPNPEAMTETVKRAGDEEQFPIS